MDYQFSKIDSGARLLIIPLPQAKTTSLLIGVRAGSRDETQQEFGVAHFIEHMFFKGTKKRPTYLEISRELDGLGAHFNAFTSHESTQFYIQTAARQQQEAAEILFDMLVNNTFPEQEIAKERQVICEEINLYEDMPQDKAQLEFQKLIFQGSPLARPIAGTKKSVRSLTRETMRRFMAHHYRADNLVVAVSGKVEKKLIAFIRRQLLQLKRGSQSSFQPAQPTFKRRQKLVEKGIDQAHLMIGFPTFSNRDKRRFALTILNSLLGGMMSSRLFVRIREELALAYYVGSAAHLYLDSGVLAIRAGVTKEKIDQAVDAIKKELERLKTKVVSANELKRAKDNFYGNFYLGLEDSLDVAQFYLSQELLRGEILTPKEIVSQIEKVTQNDIIELANAIFDASKENIVILK